ncbi:MAG: alpha/beta fold hydrolase [Anaerolineaceae bacterium]|nr:alpha/beta fold hydrolase [Anaerolineaceae bacterium]
MPKIKVNNVDLYYELHGPEDVPVLILVNGVLMSTASWVMQTPVLSRKYRVLLHDCRGQGQSEHPSEPYSMEGHMEDLRVLMDVLEIDQAHIAGISYGGEISLLAGIHMPERVKSLFISSAVSEIRPMLRTIIESWIACAQINNGELLYRCSVTDNFSENFLKRFPDLAETSIPRYEKLDFPAVVNLCQSFLNLDFTEQLKQISARTMVVVGELDTVKPPEYSRLIAEEIPGSQLMLLGDAGHACCLETPQTWNAALLGFLAEVESQVN